MLGCEILGAEPDEPDWQQGLHVPVHGSDEFQLWGEGHVRLLRAYDLLGDFDGNECAGQHDRDGLGDTDC